MKRQPPLLSPALRLAMVAAAIVVNVAIGALIDTLAAAPPPAVASAPLSVADAAAAGPARP